MIDGNTKVSELLDESENQNELEHKANEHGAIDKDFYEKLPTWYPETMENLDKDFYGRPWFEEAWKKYRDHVMNSETKNIRAPGYIFNSYIKKDHELNPTQVRMGLMGDYYLYPELRSSKEREADCKEVCYSEEDINSLRHFDEKEHPRGKNGQFINKGFTKEDQKKLDTLKKQNDLLSAQQTNQKLKEAPYKQAIQNAQKASEMEIKAVSDLGKGVSDVAKGVDAIIEAAPGSDTKTVYGSYPNLSDKYMNDRINRINLEQRYSNAVGDTKTVLTGKGKAHEALQTITALSGIGIAIAGLIIGIRSSKK